MPSSTSSTTNPGFGLGALVTTGVVSAITAFSASLLYFHYFPQVQERPAPIAVVDIVKMGMAVTKLTQEGQNNAFSELAFALKELQNQGYIVLDSRMVLGAPDEYLRKPSDLMLGAPNYDQAPSGYATPNLFEAPIPTTTPPQPSHVAP